jgi:ADP-ribose 1''-phosphate phosphatase
LIEIQYKNSRHFNMSKQTRLNFSKATTASSKRRRLNSNDETQEQELNDHLLKQSKRPGPPSSEETNKAELEAPPDNSKPSDTKTQTPSDPSSKKARLEASSNSETMNPQTRTSSIPKSTTSNPSNESKPNPHITLTYQKASLFASPPATLLCHATNAQGTWGAGIAAAFKTSYPAAFKLYAAHCKAWDSGSLLGTTFLIPPQKKSTTKAEREAEHWIGCLFTSEKKGKGKGSKESILAATGEAIEDLVRKVKAVNETDAAGPEKGKSTASTQDRIAEVRMCKINSGLFGVPWEATSEVIEAVEVGEGDIEEIAVFSMD